MTTSANVTAATDVTKVPALPASGNSLALASLNSKPIAGATASAQYGFWYSSGGSQTTFDLPLAPQEINIDEPFATSIVPTIGAGKFIERRGSIFKTITVAGTFGFNSAAAQLQQVAGANGTQAVNNNDSAFYKFHNLRKFFRDYAAQFITEESHSYMVWVNTKDGENFVVEPMTFRLKRQRAMLYSYQIELRVIGVYTGETRPVTPEARLTAEEYAKKVQEVVDTAVADAVAAARAGIKPADNPATSTTKAEAAPVAPTATTPQKDTASLSARLQNGALLISNNINQNINQAAGYVLAPFNESINVFSSIFNAVASVQATVFSVADSGIQTALGALAALRYATRLVTLAETKTQIELLKGQASLVGDAGKALAAAWGYDTASLPGGANPAAYANNTSTGQAALTLTGGRTAVVDTGQPAKPTDSAYGQTTTTNSPTSLPASLVTDTRQETLLPGETGEAFAARVVGTVGAWPLIVLLNQLKPPYFSNGVELLPNTVRPGDDLIIPVFGGTRNDDNTLLSDTSPVVSFLVQVKAYDAVNKKVTVEGRPGWRSGRWVGYKVINALEEELAIVESGSDYFVMSSVFTDPLPVGELLEVKSLTERAPSYANSASVLSRAMGRDLKLVRALPPAYSPEAESVDLNLSAGGDVALVDGQANFFQAIGIKLRSRYGDLPVHTNGTTSFGLAPNIGGQANSSALFKLSVGVQNTLLSDPRIASVRNIRMMIDRDVLTTSFDVQPVGSKLFQSISGTIV